MVLACRQSFDGGHDWRSFQIPDSLDLGRFGWFPSVSEVAGGGGRVGGVASEAGSSMCFLLPFWHFFTFIILGFYFGINHFLYGFQLCLYFLHDAMRSDANNNYQHDYRTDATLPK